MSHVCIVRRLHHSLMMKTKIVSDTTKLYLENLMRRGTLGDAGTNGMIDIKIYLKKFIVID